MTATSRDLAAAILADHGNPGSNGHQDPGAGSELWAARPVLAHLRDFARARMVSPWAVLGVTLARVTAATPPFVVLPAITGGQASLNLFCALVGPSGCGKGAAEMVARDALDVGRLETMTCGSGEAIAHAYVERDKEGTVWQHTDRVLFSVAEVDTLTALVGRQASTLMPELRRAWSGEALGFHYVDKSKRLPVPEHKYRLGLVVGVQPGRAAGLFDDEDGGTPQRFLWLPATDPGAPDVTPPEPPSMVWEMPRPWPLADRRGRVDLPVCDEARDTIVTARRARVRGDGHALDGHSLLTRLKTAAALSLLDGRAEVGPEDWRLAGMVLDQSDACRASVVATLAAAGADANHRRGVALGAQAVIVQEATEDAAVKKVARTITRYLGRHPGGTFTHRELARATTSGSTRGHFDDALARVVESGQVEAEDALVGSPGRQEMAAKYRLAAGAQ